MQNPVLAAGLVAGSAAGAYAIYNYHATLEYIGVLSLLLTFVRKLASYDSPQDFFEEVRCSNSEAADVIAFPAGWQLAGVSSKSPCLAICASR